MLRNNLKGNILRVITCVAMLLTVSHPAFAAEIHENPETAPVVFSGIALLRYYTESLDFVLHKDAVEVEARLEKMPFANIIKSLEESADSFSASGVEISKLVVVIDENLETLRGLIGQSRLEEAAKMAAGTFASLSQAYIELDGIEQAAETTGDELKVPSSPEKSTLRQAYDELVERIDRIRQMLDLYKKLLLSLFLNFAGVENINSVEEAAKLAEQLASIMEELRDTYISEEFLAILASGRLLPTTITLEIEPTITFVGDNISFEGSLTSDAKPLAGRKIDILLNSSLLVTVETDSHGHYHGTLQVPYWYQLEIDVQALYYPQDKDIGIYLASLSPVVKLKVLFYESRLEVTVEDKAYPGLDTTITGKFDYGQSPLLSERKVELYLDDVLIFDTIEQKTFSKTIKIDPDVELGKHNITVSALPLGRYASVIAGATLNVIQAVPILDISLPKVALIPGSVSLAGKLYSEVAPLSSASINMRLGKSLAELASSENGVFDAKIRVGMGFGLFGWQDLVIQVLPREPWHATLVTTKSLVIVNWVNSGSILIILVFLSVYLPSTLRRRFGIHWKKRERPTSVIAQPEYVPTYSVSVVTSVPAEEKEETNKEPRDRIFYWYRLVVRLIQGITKVLLKPQQTLREFARDSSKLLGPVAQYFTELTEMVERTLYSRYRPTEEYAEKSLQLYVKIEEETKIRVATQPLPPEKISGVGVAAQFEPGGLTNGGGVIAYDFNDRLPNTTPWQQFSSWLWVLLILAVVYYACVLLFILPLLIASFA